jgi:hypothetical protein
MAGISGKELKRIVQHVETQGVTITRTKKGLLMRLPNGKTTMLHFTNSDHRGRLNFRAELKRAGVTLPDEKLPNTQIAEYIMRPMTPKVLDRARTVLDLLGNPPEVSSGQLTQVLKTQGLPVDPTFPPRALYHTGYRPTPKTRGRFGTVWQRELTEAEAAADLAATLAAEDAGLDVTQSFTDAELAAQELAARPLELVPDLQPEADQPETPNPEGFSMTVKTHWRPEHEHDDVQQLDAGDGREFIDTVDSWSVDLASLPPKTRIAQLAEHYRAAGLAVELRVWRL